MDAEFENQQCCQSETDIVEPEDYKVILLNDDYTTKDFVVSILIQIFNKPESEAVAIMESVHKTGRGIVGIYPFDIAQTYVAMVRDFSRKNGFPLRCSMEKN